MSKEILNPNYVERPKIVSSPLNASKMLLDRIKKKHNLNERQAATLDLVNQKHNIFLTGKAGTGKSKTVQAIQEFLGSKIALTASTGIAALNINGSTLHTWLGTGLMKQPLEYLIKKTLSKEWVVNNIRTAHTLLIDEISMLSSREIEVADAILQCVRTDYRPFGGLQVILVGDLLQLPFVNKLDDYDQCDIEKQVIYKSELWKKLNLKVSYLTENMRQGKDLTFINHLNDLRNGIFSKEWAALIREKHRSKEFYEHYADQYITICTKNEDAQKINERNYNKNTGEERFYDVTVYKGTREDISKYEGFSKILPNGLYLKVGSKVIVEYNINPELGLVNGTRGTIVRFNQNVPILEYDYVYPDGSIEKKTHALEPHEFNEYNWNHKTKTNDLMITVVQYPINLCYAMSVNRAQGLTLDKVILDLSPFSYQYAGQIYTAVSRCRSLNNLLIKSFCERQFFEDGTNIATDLDALELYKAYEKM